MKKFLLIISILILLTGCSKLSSEDKLYKKEVKDLQQVETFDTDFPFNIDINIVRLTDYEITYRLTIDNIDENVNNIRALVIHNQETNSVYPSVGIYEEKIDLTKQNKKGILLVGYIDYKGDIKDFKGEFKASITYDEDKTEITKYYSKNY